MTVVVQKLHEFVFLYLDLFVTIKSSQSLLNAQQSNIQQWLFAFTEVYAYINLYECRKTHTRAHKNVIYMQRLNERPNRLKKNSPGKQSS